MSDPRFRCLVVPSAYSRRLLVAAGWPADKLRVIAYGFDPDEFAPDGPGKGIAARTPDRFRALFVGGLLHRKGVDVLYEAWRLAFTADEDVQLILKAQGGQTFYRGQFLDPPADLPHVSVLAEDDFKTAEMAALYRRCQVVVQPYRYEGFCLPLLEATACGVPVVYPGHGPAPEFVPPKAGIKLPDAEPATLARALRYLYEHPEVRRMMGSKAAAGTTLTWPRVAHLWAGLIEEVCGE
jgi:glycosyltransferase involved in cell wall biosynthesis